MNNLISVYAIRAKDIMRLLGCSPGHARRQLCKARKAFKKCRGQIITVEEYCTYKGYDAVKVVAFLTTGDKH